MGRGAVFANESVSSSNIGVAQPGKTGKIGTAMPSFYVSRDQLIERNEKNTIPQMAPILRRIGLYDPESQFVVVFETDGMQGADIVTPNQRPAVVWKRTKREAQDGDGSPNQ